MRNRRSLLIAGMLLAALTTAACGGGGSKDAGSAAITGDTVVVEMYTDAVGNYFKPNEIAATRGDVIRFVLKAGVHNVNFLPDSNTIKTGLPPMSDFLQLPEQTYDLIVNLQDGEYFFQCDPHAALGMTGKLRVAGD